MYPGKGTVVLIRPAQTFYERIKLRVPTDFCVGATIDLGRGIRSGIALTRRKVETGAQFFVSQPTFSPDSPREFMTLYADRFGEQLSPPLFHGVQVMAQDSIAFGNLPQWVADDLARGRSGGDIALEVLHGFVAAGFRSFYLVPPILRGGRRDYDAARAVLEAFDR